MSGVSYGWVACKVSPDQIRDLEGLRTLYANNANPNWDGERCCCFDWHESETLDEYINDSGVINLGCSDTEMADAIVDDSLRPFFIEAFKQGLIAGVIHVRYHDIYVDNYGSSGGLHDLYLSADGEVEDPLNLDTNDIPLAQRLELIKQVNSLVADAKRKALGARETASV